MSIYKSFAMAGSVMILPMTGQAQEPEPETPAVEEVSNSVVYSLPQEGAYRDVLPLVEHFALQSADKSHRYTLAADITDNLEIKLQSYDSWLNRNGDLYSVELSSVPLLRSIPTSVFDSATFNDDDRQVLSLSKNMGEGWSAMIGVAADLNGDAGENDRRGNIAPGVRFDDDKTGFLIGLERRF